MTHLASCVNLQQAWKDVELSCVNNMEKLIITSFPEVECSRTMLKNLFFPTHTSMLNVYEERSLRLRGFLTSSITELIKNGLNMCDNQIKFIGTKFLLHFSTQVHNVIWKARNEATMAWEQCHNITSRTKKSGLKTPIIRTRLQKKMIKKKKITFPHLLRRCNHTKIHPVPSLNAEASTTNHIAPKEKMDMAIK